MYQKYYDTYADKEDGKGRCQRDVVSKKYRDTLKKQVKATDNTISPCSEHYDTKKYKKRYTYTNY